MYRDQIRQAFTLVEILIVVVILSILAVIVIAMFNDTTKQATQTAFISDTKVFVDAAMLYQVKTGDYLEDSSTGDVPAGFDTYIDTRVWMQETPIGGEWDCELDSFGIKSALGVHFQGDQPDDAYMIEIDSILDDGDLTTGAFRKIAGSRFYYILDES